MHNLKGEITEIFSSIQGEGIFLGAKQIFVRFKRCNLTCDFCDTPRDVAFKEYSSPELMGRIKYLEETRGPHHSVSLTGGEPLLYSEFLRIFLKSLKRGRFKSYLETNGTLPDELSRVIDLVDIIAMDVKLPSSTHERPRWGEHLDFLKIAIKKKVFVKAVITIGTSDSDIEKAIAMIKKIKSDIPLILQPASVVRRHDKVIDTKRLLTFLEAGSRNKFENMRVIPQVHKILNVK